MSTDYITCADTAKALRKALKAAFPSTPFSVRSKTYSGGASIDIRWTDGPTTAMVEKISKAFAGASFDPMIDLKSYHTSLYEGKPVHWGADYVFTQRSESKAVLEHAAARVAAKWGYPVPAIVTDAWGGGVIDPSYPDKFTHPGGHRYDLSDLIYQEARTLYVYNGTIYATVTP
jgi:hypothetical protein